MSCLSFEKSTFENYLVVPESFESCISFSQSALLKKHCFRTKYDPHFHRFLQILRFFKHQPLTYTF